MQHGLVSHSPGSAVHVAPTAWLQTLPVINSGGGGGLLVPAPSAVPAPSVALPGSSHSPDAAQQ